MTIVKHAGSTSRVSQRSGSLQQNAGAARRCWCGGMNGAHARTRCRRVEDPHRPDPPPPDAPADLVELRDALGRLPWEQRAAIVLRFWVDLPDEQTAAVLGCATGTVRSHISRGVSVLRKELS